MTFFVDIIAIGMIAISVNWTMQFRSMLASKVFIDFMLLLLFNLLLIAFVIYPLLIRLTCGKVNPYRVLYAEHGVRHRGLFLRGRKYDPAGPDPARQRKRRSSPPHLERHHADVLDLRPRRQRPLTVTVSFIVILKSYSSLGIAF